VSYLGSLAQTTAWVGDYMTKYRQVVVSLERLQALMQGAPPGQLVEPRTLHLWHGPPESPSPAPPASGRLDRLEACGLTFCYPGSERGVAGVDLALERGSFTVVTGRVGA